MSPDRGPSRRIPSRSAPIVVAVGAVVLVTGFVLLALLLAEPDKRTPQQTAHALVDAINAKDIVGVRDLFCTKDLAHTPALEFSDEVRNDPTFGARVEVVHSDSSPPNATIAVTYRKRTTHLTWPMAKDSNDKWQFCGATTVTRG